MRPFFNHSMPSFSKSNAWSVQSYLYITVSTSPWSSFHLRSSEFSYFHRFWFAEESFAFSRFLAFGTTEWIWRGPWCFQLQNLELLVSVNRSVLHKTRLEKDNLKLVFEVCLLKIIWSTVEWLYEFFDGSQVVLCSPSLWTYIVQVLLENVAMSSGICTKTGRFTYL